MILQVISPEDLEILIGGGRIRTMYSEAWLSLVRMFPCMHPECNIQRAGTAHHLYNWGLSLVCSDYLTIPLCLTHHVLGPKPIQQATEDEFEQIMGMTKADAIRRNYYLIIDKIRSGDLLF